MTNANAGFNDRYCRVFHHSADQAGAAAGDNHVKIFIQFQHCIDRLAVSRFDQLNRVLAGTGLFRRRSDYTGDEEIGSNRFRAAAQDDSIA